MTCEIIHLLVLSTIRLITVNIMIAVASLRLLLTILVLALY